VIGAPAKPTSTWDTSVDVVVMGSGAAGFTAALRCAHLGMRVLIVEKGRQWGGSTSMSAGLVWVPNNRGMRAAGIPDSDESAITYLSHLTGGRVAHNRIQTFVRETRRMADWLCADTQVLLAALPNSPDYHPDAPGGSQGGRSMEPLPVDGTRLGEEFATLHAPYFALLFLGRMLLTTAEARWSFERGLKSKLPALRRLRRYIHDTARRRRLGRDPYLTWGQALSARLRLSLLERGVPMWLSCPVEELVVDEARVVGVIVECDGSPQRVQARRGVVIAAGGFEHNAAMRERYQRHPIDVGWTVGNADNTGDGINIALEVGAALDTDLVREAWWLPATPAPGRDSPSILVVEKALPHGIYVDRNGKRFVNEAGNYSDTVLEMYRRHESNGASIPAWFVFDGRYRSRFFVGPLLPRPLMPDRRLPPELRPGAGWLHRAESIEALAKQLGIDPPSLQATVERFNGFAARGVDEDFHRGSNANDRYYADPRCSPNPTLGALSRAPFYAVPIIPSDLGTKAGLMTDVDGRVLDNDGKVIRGLYAAGNSATTAMGDRYPSAGATIASAMTQAFLAAEACDRDTTPSP
jgi:3-oxosteroid 1-dehydrogenase